MSPTPRPAPTQAHIDKARRQQTRASFRRWFVSRWRQQEAFDALDVGDMVRCRACWAYFGTYPAPLSPREVRRANRNAGEPYVTYGDPPNLRGNRAQLRVRAPHADRALSRRLEATQRLDLIRAAGLPLPGQMPQRVTNASGKTRTVLRVDVHDGCEIGITYRTDAGRKTCTTTDDAWAAWRQS